MQGLHLFLLTDPICEMMHTGRGIKQYLGRVRCTLRSLSLCTYLGFYPIDQQICVGPSVRVLSLLLREFRRQ